MNNTRIYKERERHYNRLVARLSKVQNKGCSKSLQSRLSARLERCLMQLKQLSTGVAVLAALGCTAPVLAQSNNTVPLSYVEKTGVDNPFDTIGLMNYAYFSDIDGDGDQDMIAGYQVPFSSCYTFEYSYYKNEGSATMPRFELQTNSTLLDTLDQHATGLSFVDIDGDGDQDLFVTDDSYCSRDTMSRLYYYENTSLDPANPVYTLKSSNNNPLQKVADYYNSLNSTLAPPLYVSFCDIDEDGDQDCFVGAGYGLVGSSNIVLYYKNEGSSISPDFQLQTGNDNPLNLVSTIMNTNNFFTRNMFFFDGDSTRDGDLDVGFVMESTTRGGIFQYLKNNGTLIVPNYVNSTNTPIDNISINYGVGKNRILGIVDLTDDGRSEMIFRDIDATNKRIRYFVDTVSYLNHLIYKGAKVLNSYPNPSTGLIQLNQALTGHLRVCNALGQEVYSRALNEAPQLDLSTLSNGVYILHIRTKEEDYVQQVMITRK